MTQRLPDQNENEPSTWTISLPFTLSPGKEISLKDGVHQGKVDQWECCLSRGESIYTLKVSGLPDSSEAEAFVQRLGGGLLWVRGSVQSGIQFNLNLGNVTYFDDPKKAARNIFGPDTKRLVECVIDRGRTAIYPSEKQIATVTAFPVTVSMGIPPERFISALAKGTCLPNAAQVVENRRIMLASEIYSQSHFESSLKSRFLSQMTVLEVLSDRPKQPNELQKYIQKWVLEVDEVLQLCKNLGEKKTIERFKDRIHKLKEESITESVRVFVRKAMKQIMDPKASELAGKIGALYGVRSDIVHGRNVNVGQSPAELQEIVSKSLLAAIEHPSLLTESCVDSPCIASVF